MGTNYYARVNACKACGHSNNEVHIGKSSHGWAFALHVTPALETLDDWKEYLAHPEVSIRNEYGAEVIVEELLSIITDRLRSQRHPVDGGHCVGHGDGTYDYIAGEFS